jgi:hypothetical protein
MVPGGRRLHIVARFGSCRARPAHRL